MKDGGVGGPHMALAGTEFRSLRDPFFPGPFSGTIERVIRNGGDVR
jgi:hypothetical protein